MKHKKHLKDVKIIFKRRKSYTYFKDKNLYLKEDLIKFKRRYLTLKEDKIIFKI